MKTKQASASSDLLGVALAHAQAPQPARLALGGGDRRAGADLDVGQPAICSIR